MNLNIMPAFQDPQMYCENYAQKTGEIQPHLDAFLQTKAWGIQEILKLTNKYCRLQIHKQIIHRKSILHY